LDPECLFRVIQEFDYDDYLTWKTYTNKLASPNIPDIGDNVVSSTMTSQETSTRDVNNNPQTEQAAGKIFLKVLVKLLLFYGVTLRVLY